MTSGVAHINAINILLVDDSKTNLSLMKAILSTLPVSIHTASSGLEALALLKENDFAVIYLDVQMPGMDGYELAGIITAEKKAAHIPIVFITAVRKDNENIKKGYAVGAIDYLTKPIDPEILLAKTKIFMTLYEQKYKLSNMVRQLDVLANTDTLTGLPNRYQFNYVFKKVLAGNVRYSRNFALLLLDMDNFKDINDKQGHDVGDQLLVEFSTRLQSILREADHASRLGGDEFAILLSEVDTSNDVGHIASKLVRELRAPFYIDKLKLNITVSIGVAVYPQAGTTVNALFKSADIALYRAKDKGKNAFEYFTDGLNEAYLRRAEVENHLQSAIRKNEISIVYQPRVNMETKKVVGVEALARWHNEKLGTVAPTEFIPIAENMGYMGELGLYLMSEAFSHFHEWQSLNKKLLCSMAVNLSPYQLEQPGFIEDLAQLVRKYNIDIDHLEFEITESVFRGGNDRLETSISELRELGVKFAIDDFGTGYSSLSRLKLLPIRTLKIDKSFVRDITTDSNDAAIVKAIISLADALQMEVVAEGVELKEQESYLLKNGCSSGQGFYYYMPVSASKIKQLILN